MTTAGKKDAEAEYREKISEDIRPWGKFRCFPHKKARSIKIITVNPGGVLSLQYHYRRCEFWIILDGGLEVTVGDKIWQPEKNEEIFIPKRTPHRLRCRSGEPGRVMEIWLGNSEESDIIRLKDEYGRK